MEIIKNTAPEFVQIVENGLIDAPETYEIVRCKIEHFLAAGADEIVLGCTHFPFLKGIMEQVALDKAEIIDPSAAVARQVKRVVDCVRAASSPAGGSSAELPTKRHVFMTTKPGEHFRHLLGRLASW